MALPSFLAICLRLLVTDREPAVGVEEVHVAGIHRELDPVAGPDAAAALTRAVHRDLPS
jgi:hypothetical protein